MTIVFVFIGYLLGQYAAPASAQHNAQARVAQTTSSVQTSPVPQLPHRRHLLPVGLSAVIYPAGKQRFGLLMGVGAFCPAPMPTG